MSVSYGGDSITFADGSVQSGGWTGMRNRIINGAMVIDQRNAGASVTPVDNQITLDRWRFSLSQASKLTTQQSTVAPTGFGNSSLITSTSAYSVGASEGFLFAQKIEGFNFYDMAWGTASASTVTLSFWVRSSLTGAFGGAVSNGANNRWYPFSYTISSANTWEQKSVTIAGDTSGTWVGATNGTGLNLYFSLGSGATVSGTSGSWGASTFYSATGATSVVGTNGATFYITGVQLERGSTASSFEYRSYGAELTLCQRYCFVPTNIPMTGGSSSFVGNLQFPVTMRSAPSLDTTKLGTYKNSSSFGVGPGANEFGIQNFVSGNSVGFSGVTPTSLGQTTQSTQVTYIYQVSGTTPSESTSVMNYVCSFGTGSRLILSAEL